MTGGGKANNVNIQKFSEFFLHGGHNCIEYSVPCQSSSQFNVVAEIFRYESWSKVSVKW
jgi:hypothetical protein